MNKAFSFSTVAIITLSLIACDGGYSSSSPTNQNPQETETGSSSSNKNQSATSSSTNSGNDFADLSKPEKDVFQSNESNELPSMYGLCSTPVYWDLKDSVAILNSNPSGTDCDSLDVKNPETWKYAFKYTKNDGQDTVIGHHSYQVSENCLIERTSATFTATPRSHIKGHGSLSLTPAFVSMCMDNECFSTLDIVNSFKEVQEACLKVTKKDNIQMFKSIDEIAVDTTIYITQTEYDCEYKGLCD